MTTRSLFAFAALLPVLVYGCAAEEPPAGSEAGEEDEYTSASAKLLDFEFDGEVTSAGGDAEQTIRDQMLFTIGQLNGEVGVGRPRQGSRPAPGPHAAEDLSGPRPA